MGGFDHKQSVAPTDNPDAPLLRVSGVAFMGGVGVQVRYPGESKRDARHRLRDKRKELKRIARARRRGSEPEGGNRG
jgi:hypothetical protein